MILGVSVVIAVVFGSGAFLVLQRDLLRVVIGIVLVSNSAILFIMAAGLSRGTAPIYPIGEGAVSDPLVQAMALTALVIGSSVAALLLAVVYRLYVSHSSVDIEEIFRMEMREAEELERENETEPDIEEEADEKELEKGEPR
ncbi:MAG TPA: NADH-quinone oxidoreductase subunit K [Rubrobacteraceae bacterium]|nr:NADH-quinone oxidoreductase subunit K [Rubrobacteraceae bacterium]